MLNIEDTICAPATVPGTGAIAIIRMSGKDSFRIADKVVSCKGSTISETEGYKLRYGVALEADGTDLDTVLVSVFRSPHSYTGEDSVEISCHSSKYVVERLLQRLVDSGARPAGPGEFTQRAFVNGKMDLAQAEAVADVISSQNAAAHRVAYSQLKGGFSKELKTLRDELLKMTSLLELELDFSEEDVEFASRRELSALLDGALRHIHSLTDSFRYGNALRNGVPVAIVGAVNAGKSTLLNALVGDDRAIVSDIAGTTRDTIEDTVNIAGTTFRFIDTAGIRDTAETIEAIGISRTYSTIERASVILLMLDATRPGTFGESFEAIASRLNHVPSTHSGISERALLILLNKADLLSEPEIPAMLTSAESLARRKGLSPTRTLAISARNRLGLPEITAALAATAAAHTTDTSATLVTNLRHYQALQKALEALTRAREALLAGVSTEFVTQDIREALHHIGEICGEVTSEEVLGTVFSRFCIGK